MCNQIFNPKYKIGVKSYTVKVKDFFKDESIIRRKDIERIQLKVKAKNLNKDIQDKIHNIELLDVKELIKMLSINETGQFGENQCLFEVDRKIKSNIKRFFESGKPEDVANIIKRMQSGVNDDEYFYLLVDLMYRKIIKIIWKLFQQNKDLNFKSLHLEEERINDSLNILIRDLQIVESDLVSFQYDDEEHEQLKHLQHLHTIKCGPDSLSNQFIKEFKRNSVDIATVLEVNKELYNSFSDKLKDNQEVEIFPENALDAGFEDENVDSNQMIILTIQNKNRIQIIERDNCYLHTPKLQELLITTTFNNQSQCIAQCQLSYDSRETRFSELETLLERHKFTNDKLILCGYLVEDLNDTKKSGMMQYLFKDHRFVSDSEVEACVKIPTYTVDQSSLVPNVDNMGKQDLRTIDIIIARNTSIKADKYKVIKTQTFDHNIINARF